MNSGASCLATEGIAVAELFRARYGEVMEPAGKPTPVEKLSLTGALRYYWPHVWLVAATPAASVLAFEFFPYLVPLVFFGLLGLGILVPYRIGKAPYSYVLACGLIHFFVGSAIAAA